KRERKRLASTRSPTMTIPSQVETTIFTFRRSSKSVEESASILTAADSQPRQLRLSTQIFTLCPECSALERSLSPSGQVPSAVGAIGPSSQASAATSSWEEFPIPTHNLPISSCNLGSSDSPGS